jgi:hypothetical protein
MKMTNLKNKLRSGVFGALLSALSAVFILTGCFNLIDPRPTGPAAQAGAGSLSVSIAGQGGGERTLYPNAAFTKYELTFEADGLSYESKILEEKSAEVFSDIPAGEWTITAKGYVTINGTSYAAAEGSETVSIAAGQSKSVSIAIKATQEGDNGHFYYNIGLPEGKTETATLTLSRYGDSGSYSTLKHINLKESPSGYVDSEEAGSGLAPGYYRVDIRLYNGYQSAGISEVVHIYSNMETRAEYAYTEADFVDLVTLSGTIKLDGAAPEAGVSVWLTACERRADGNYSSIGSVSVSGGDWSIEVPEVSESTEIFFEANFYEDGQSTTYASNIPGITLNPGDTAPSAIALNLITLSGTVSAAVDGKTVSSVEISAYPEEGGDGIGSVTIPYTAGAAWSMIVPAFSKETTVAFDVYLNYSSGSGQLRGISPTRVHNSAVPGINLKADYSTVILSGTIGAITVDSAAPTGSIQVIAYNQDGNRLGSTYAESGAWSISIAPGNYAYDYLGRATSISFRVRTLESGYDLSQEIQPDATKSYTGGSVPNIELGAVDFKPIILKGTIGAVTVNGAAHTGSVQVFAYNQDDESLGSYTYPESGAWSIIVSPTATVLERTDYISFRVTTYADNVSLSQDAATIPYAGKSILDIELGPVDFKPITLSGTIGKLTVNGDAYTGSINIQAYNQNDEFLGPMGPSNGIGSNGAWSISIAPTNPVLASTTSISFRVTTYTDSLSLSEKIPAVKENYTAGQSIPNIELGDVDFKTITLSGTIGAVTVDGGSFSGSRYIYAYNQDNTYLGSFYTSSAGEWSINLAPTNTALAATTSISFRVEAYANGASLIREAATRTYEGKSIPGIDLGDVDFTTITLSGTIGTISVDGAYSDWVQLFAYNGNRDRLGFTSVYGGDEWSMTFSASDLKDGDLISIGLNGINNVYVTKTLETCIYSSDTGSIPGIALGDVAVTTKTVSGSVANLPRGISFGYIVAYSRQAVSGDTYDTLSPYLVGVEAIDLNDGGWSFKVSSDAPASLWFVVDTSDGQSSSERAFASVTAFNTAKTVSLDIKAMTELPVEEVGIY